MPSWKKIILSGSNAILSSINNDSTVSATNITGSFTGSFSGDGSDLTGVSAFPFEGDARITGSLNVSGSTKIELPTGTAFEILEGDEDQKSRFIFDYTDGDPTFTVASRASTAKIHIRQDATTNGLYLDEAGQIYVNNSTSDGVKINGSCFASIGTNSNALDLGSTSRPWNDVYLRSTGGIIVSGGTSAQFLKADGSVDSSTYLTSVGTINLASGVTGTLPVGNGGTGLSTLTSGYIPYGNGTSAFGSNGALVFNESSKIL